MHDCSSLLHHMLQVRQLCGLVLKSQVRTSFETLSDTYKDLIR